MITDDPANDSIGNVSAQEEDAGGGSTAGGINFPNVAFPSGPSHNISTYRTHNISGFFDSKPIVDKAIHGPSKISEMRAITNNHPITHGIVINKGKNEQIMEERYTEIERENRLLFEKITHIHLKGGNVQPVN